MPQNGSRVSCVDSYTTGKALTLRLDKSRADFQDIFAH